MFNFPFLPVEGLHEYNLDWILNKMKELENNYNSNIQKIIDDILENTFAKYALHYEGETIMLKGGVNNE